MNKTELAHKMLELEELYCKLEALQAEVIEAVLELGKSQTIGRMKATYYSGRTKVDYTAAFASSGLPQATLEDYARVEYNYRQACLDHDVDVEQHSERSAPYVTLKLMGE